ncbi:putative phosphoribosylaminoimidazole carboxylase [Rosa chinensis]|uniref:Putative phosphoribosylaminoimidazole carboxylase n=1 Tax=Rosa chinensis TaxID=74649 RepID=A0A2P6PSY8_ROSCH|nr:putative phosphoribosylaminoimidazole carboxylase [Rosa chinensis]
MIMKTIGGLFMVKSLTRLLVNAVGTLIFPSQPMVQIDDLEGAKRAGDLFDYPIMIKSKRLAYDGRGNDVAKSEHDLSSTVTVEPIALLLLSKFVAALGGFDRGLYVEKWAPFVKELAVIVARGRDNSIVCYLVVETIHKENICDIVSLTIISSSLSDRHHQSPKTP